MGVSYCSGCAELPPLGSTVSFLFSVTAWFSGSAPPPPGTGARRQPHPWSVIPGLAPLGWAVTGQSNQNDPKSMVFDRYLQKSIADLPLRQKGCPPTSPVCGLVSRKSNDVRLARRSALLLKEPPFLQTNPFISNGWFAGHERKLGAPYCCAQRGPGQ